MDDLSELADGIARAGTSNEAELLLQGVALLGPQQGCAERARLARVIEIGAYTDCALMLHRMTLPHHGFELGRTPARRSFAGSWHNRNAQLATIMAATPALALLRATLTTVAGSRRENDRATCTRCSGRGWYVTARCSKEICRH